MRQPAEDNPKWTDIAHEMKTPVNLECRICKAKIVNWHCAESGCPWCASCGANAKPKKEP